VFYACKGGHLAAVRVLVEEGGADLTHVTHKHLTVLHHGASSESQPLVEYLLQRLSQATPHHDADAQKVSIRRQVNQGTDRELGTPLHWAARSGCALAVRALLGVGANADALDGTGLTALHLAAVAGHADSVRTLVQAAPTDARRAQRVNAVIAGDGATALHLAAEFGHAAVVEVLLSGGATPYKDNEGDTPFELARRQQHMATLAVFKRHGIDRSSGASAQYANPGRRLGEAFKVKGNQCFQRRQFTEAIHLYGKAIEADRANHIFYSNRSACFYHMGRFEEAYEDAERCTVLAPGWAKGFYRRGMAALQLPGEDQLQDAETCFRRGIKADPSFKENHRGLEQVLEKQRQLQPDVVVVEKVEVDVGAKVTAQGEEKPADNA
jgi:ankyrin repeat protein